jgi:hypothetical protein
VNYKILEQIATQTNLKLTLAVVWKQIPI